MATITQGKTYVDVTIEQGTNVLVFPDTVIGGVKPGALDGLKNGSRVIWGSNMTQEIEPDVLGKNIYALMLGPNYKHLISHEIFSNIKVLFIHIDNIDLIPKNWKNDIWIWRSDRPLTMDDFNDQSYICKYNVLNRSYSVIFLEEGIFFNVKIDNKKFDACSKNHDKSTESINEMVNELKQLKPDDFAFIRKIVRSLDKQ